MSFKYLKLFKDLKVNFNKIFIWVGVDLGKRNDFVNLHVKEKDKRISIICR